MRLGPPARLASGLAIALGCSAIASCTAARPDGASPGSPLRTLEGYHEADYDLIAGGVRYAGVKVRSRGVELSGPAGRAAVHVGFAVDNAGPEPIELVIGETGLESLQADRPAQEALVATLAGGDPVIPADATGLIEVYVALPAGVAPERVRAFRARWTLRSQGRRFTELTPFVIRARKYAFVPVTGYYLPYQPFDRPLYEPPGASGPTRVVIVKPYPRRVVVRGRR